jgi:endonuclease YncB( thermonuclease family)
MRYIAFILVLAIILVGVDIQQWQETAAARLTVISELVSSYFSNEVTPPEDTSIRRDTTLAEDVEEIADELPDVARVIQKLKPPIKVRKGRVTKVIDGDTIEFKEEEGRYKVRLTEIDAPESDQPWGKEAERALANKIHRKNVEIHDEGIDRYGRLLGRIYFEGRDISQELVEEGHAWVYREYMSDPFLLKDELSARQADLGLWQLGRPVPPWDWRQGQRKASFDFMNPTCWTQKTCGQMESCKEARFYLEECGLTRLDGDGDGVPCESLCR